MRRSAPRRWHDWVIVLGVLGLTVTGVWTLWGRDLTRLFKPDEATETTTPAAGAETPAAPAAPPVAPPPGQAAGPF